MVIGSKKQSHDEGLHDDLIRAQAFFLVVGSRLGALKFIFSKNAK